MRHQGWRRLPEQSLSCPSQQPAVSSQVTGDFPWLLGKRMGRTQHFWQLIHQKGRGEFLGELEVSSETERGTVSMEGVEESS